MVVGGFSGLSQEAAYFLFSRSGKCQVGQNRLRHRGKHEQIEDHCMKGRQEGKKRAACVSALKFSGNILYISADIHLSSRLTELVFVVAAMV